MSDSAAPSMVADLALARRLERTEALGNVDFVEARGRAFPDRGAEWIEVAGAYAMFDGVGSPCTQTFGMGLFATVNDAHFDTLEQFFQRRGADVAHEICPLVDASLVRRICERGYVPIELSNVLFRPLSAAPTSQCPPGDSIRVRPVMPGEEGLWARVGALGWSDVVPQLGDFILELQAMHPHLRKGRHFLAEKHGEAIAAGALHLAEGVALLAGACTIPQFRRQGAQRALLEHRLQFAVDQGCDVAMIVAAPGSASQRNAERQGFRVAYTRTKWCLSATVGES